MRLVQNMFEIGLFDDVIVSTEKLGNVGEIHIDGNPYSKNHFI